MKNFFLHIMSPVYGLLHTFRVGSVYVTLAVTFERFHAIICPLRHFKRKKYMLPFCILFAILYNIPKYFELKIVVSHFSFLKSEASGASEASSDSTCCKLQELRESFYKRDEIGYCRQNWIVQTKLEIVDQMKRCRPEEKLQTVRCEKWIKFFKIESFSGQSSAQKKCRLKV